MQASLRFKGAGKRRATELGRSVSWLLGSSEAWMLSQFLKGSVIAITAGGILYLTLLALNKGPSELTALAAVFTAGAAFLASMKTKDK